eukprot:TRINITY_DN8704_c0_g1_i1.p1 TRINITY_DN8704_c0_g1~~TRINITY_DN8704_c0_g1_i1.p1  ORF type:complete len:387 (-),score=34.51 TRINITY_DN8704_c0_g1_i1:66-1163(-)
MAQPGLWTLCSIVVVSLFGACRGSSTIHAADAACDAPRVDESLVDPIEETALLQRPSDAKDRQRLPFRTDLAEKGTLYSSAAYCPHHKLKNWPNEFNSQRCKDLGAQLWSLHQHTISRAAAFIAIDREEQAVVAVFKGSNETQDLINDLRGLVQVRSPCRIKNVDLPGRVRDGFCGYYRSLVSEGFDASLEAALAHAQAEFGRSTSLIFIGHSLGGAAAAIAAADAKFRLGVNVSISLYTLGEPRAGNREFANYLFSQMHAAYRVVHAYDVVPKLPPCRNMTQTTRARVDLCDQGDNWAHHHGQEVWYHRRGMRSASRGYRLCNANNGEDPACSGSTEYMAGRRLKGINDHLEYFGINIGGECCY